MEQVTQNPPEFARKDSPLDRDDMTFSGADPKVGSDSAFVEKRDRKGVVPPEDWGGRVQ